MMGQYDGSLKDGTPEGTGVLRSFGDVYRGEVKNGVAHGWGEKRFRHGAIYAGQFVGGDFEGYGRYVDAAGETVHEGTWSKGLPKDYELTQSVGVLKAALKFKGLR